MSMQYLRDHYNVPVKRGTRVNIPPDGTLGVVTSAKGNLLRVCYRKSGFDRQQCAYYHPFEINYHTEKRPCARRGFETGIQQAY